MATTRLCCTSHTDVSTIFARYTLDVLMNLFSQLMEAISRRDTLTFNEVFIDGTKLEANANKYTFVWRKAVEKKLSILPTKLSCTQRARYMEWIGLDTFCMNGEFVYTFLAKRKLKYSIWFWER